MKVKRNVAIGVVGVAVVVGFIVGQFISIPRLLIVILAERGGSASV